MSSHQANRKGRGPTTRGAATRERIIVTAVQLFRRKGYSGTGFREIAALSGAPVGSMYFHFPGGKEELGAACILHAAREIGALLEVATEALSPDRAVIAIAEEMGRVLEVSGWVDACPVAGAAVNAGDSEVLRVAVDDAFRLWECKISARLARDGMNADQARDLATFVIAALEGALIVAKARADIGPLDSTARQMADVVRQQTEGT